jgi:hypothetical protein
MKIEKIFCYYIAPVSEEQELKRIDIDHNGKLFISLQKTFEKAEKECNLPIVFRPEKGTQKNEVRNLILNIIDKPSIKSSDPLMERLAKFTNNKSGAGLVFIIIGKHGRLTKLLISRYKAEEAIIAEAEAENLNVELIDNAYIKKANTYKGALYIGSNKSKDFWKGSVIDKQANDPMKEVSDYWIKDFLDSEFELTPQRGSKIIANAFKQAVNHEKNLDIKQELLSATIGLKGLNGNISTIEDLIKNSNMSKEAINSITEVFDTPELLKIGFVFDHSEFKKIANYKAVFLDNGGIIIAEADNFQKIIIQTTVNESDKIESFSTQGKVINESIKARV